MQKLTIVFMLFITANLFGQNFHDEVKAVYNFIPHQMTKEEQSVIMPKLDSLFNKVIANKEEYLEPLRRELRGTDNMPYFYFDGGNLLLVISDSASDVQLAADAILKADLKDIAPFYINRLLYLSKKGANVIDAALRILDDTTFYLSAPEHNLLLDYGESLMFILPRYNSELYLDKLIEKFNQIPMVEKQITCLDLFVHANCCKADAFLKKLTTSDNQLLRTNAIELIKSSEVPQTDNPVEYAKYFEIRKKSASRISDEAVEEIQQISLDIRKNYKCSK